MDVDIIGRVRNTQLSVRKGLVPLFEAISNSIDAIEESGRDDGEITVRVNRDYDSLLIRDEEQLKIAPIMGFEVIDNGIGFTEDNFSSFNKSDSRRKVQKGGKGVGRFLWLKAFDYVEIESTFAENGSQMSRSFKFELSNNPIVDHQLTRNKNGIEFVTIVRLIGLKSEFKEHIIRKTETIAYYMVEHFLEHFVLGRMSNINLIDGDERINLTRIYTDWIAETARSDFEVAEKKFIVLHFMLQAHSGMYHKLNYCAIRRVVKEKRLDYSHIPNLPTRIEGSDDSQLIYVGYVSGDFLDENVNQQRTDFTTAQHGGLKYLGDLDWSEIEEPAILTSADYLQTFTSPIAEKTRIMVNDFVADEAPQYKGLLKHRPEIIDEIPPAITQAKLEIELHKRQKKWEVELREMADEIISQPALPDESDDEIRQKYEQFLEEWNENGKSALAKYVIHRRTTLALLEKYMQSNGEGNYALEKTIHQMIFPLKKTSDDIDYQQQNLWIIDEKLAFHRYLSSDIPLRQIDLLDSDELDRPDLLIFNNAFAIVEEEPINGVTLFEFKRPMRTNSNPVKQMFKYIRKIRSGGVKTNHGRPVTVRNETPFYCYAICDLTQTLRDDFDDMGLQVTPDGDGYFGYNRKHRAYVEVISFNKLLKDAKQRNRILFEQLNIPT